ncbi:hypothetical protein FA95DRAFT_758857 [Auriscalpium vulgare]|uniref:Uncharacterized protein n=1 Tax=Auriscalpium vulgare TaxID=40419 RepID=A0ACB8S278_9AGAM|nr:hypothetical protein FA95DRAFT_758857 [Auriscalpium vulgare]
MFKSQVNLKFTALPAYSPPSIRSHSLLNQHAPVSLLGIFLPPLAGADGDRLKTCTRVVDEHFCSVSIPIHLFLSSRSLFGRFSYGYGEDRTSTLILFQGAIGSRCRRGRFWSMKKTNEEKCALKLSIITQFLHPVRFR